MDKKVLAIYGAGAVLVLAGAIGAYFLFSLPEISRDSDKLTVGATIFPLADIARQVGGEHVRVQLILPPGASEHSSALTPQQIQDLQEAQTVFQIGHGLDDRLMERIDGAFPNLESVVVDRGIALREFGEEEGEEAHDHDAGIDPHYWLTVPNAVAIAATMADTLGNLDPANAGQYQQNLADYRRQLEVLERELQALGQALPKKEFIAMHNAWSYFTDAYGLRLVATYEPIEGQEPSLADLTRLGEIIQQYNITTFYAEPQKASTSTANFMEREFGLNVFILDPVGGGEETGSYIDLMRYNMNSIEAGGR